VTLTVQQGGGYGTGVLLLLSICLIIWNQSYLNVGVYHDDYLIYKRSDKSSVPIAVGSKQNSGKLFCTLGSMTTMAMLLQETSDMSL